MSYEYMNVPRDEALLNDLGAAGWEAVEMPEETGDVLLRRNMELPAVQNGLRKHPLNSLLLMVVLKPQSLIKFDLPHYLSKLDHQDFGGMLGEVKSASFGIRAERLFGNQPEQWLDVYKTGRIEFGRIQYPPHTWTIIPDTYWAEWTIKQMQIAAGLYKEWEYSGSIDAVLTLSGVKNWDVQFGNNSSVKHTITIPHVQVEAVASGYNDLFSSGRSLLARDLFGSMHWNLGVKNNITFDQYGNITKN